MSDRNWFLVYAKLTGGERKGEAKAGRDILTAQ